MSQGYRSIRVWSLIGSVLGIALVGAGILLVTQQSDAQDTANGKKIGVVDMRRILDESRAAQHIQKQVKAERAKLEQKFGTLEQELKQQKQKLIEEQNQLSQQAFQQKRKQFQQKLEKSRNQAQTKRRKLKQAINQAMTTLRKNVKDVVAKLGDSGHYDLVISRQGAVYAADKLDMTEAVLSRLDGNLAKIDLEYSSE